MNAFDPESVPGQASPSVVRTVSRTGKRREHRVDAIDRAILAALRANARIPYADLARLVGLSGPSVADRVKRLEQAGIVTGYHAALAPTALGPGFVALVSIEQSDDGDQDQIAAALAGLPEIEDCWLVAGDEVYVVKARVPDVPALEATLGDIRRIAGVARTHTTVVLSTKWEGRVMLDGPDPTSSGSPSGGGQ
jgi:Lrp/AsnC family transcriptional regulator, leucine-responsive regulatory protein